MSEAEHQILPDTALDQIFREARSYNGWEDKGISDVTLEAIYELMKWGPTAANTLPARLIFVKSEEAKAKLVTTLDAGNVKKVQAAPVTVIVAMDNEFYEQLPKTFPHTDARSWYVGNDKLIQDTAYRNSTLQGAYMMIAARSLGLDCGPMTGFSPDKVKAEFFPEKNWTANFICALGYGDPASIFPRSPRLSFTEACEIL